MTVTTCHIHMDRVAGAACVACARPICPLCMVRDGDGFLCPPCHERRSGSAGRGPSAGRARVVEEQVVFGIQASCEAVWEVITSPAASPLLGDCDRAMWKEGDVPGVGARVVQQHWSDGRCTEEVEFTVEHWDPPRALAVSTPGSIAFYLLTAGPHGTTLQLDVRMAVLRGPRGWGDRRTSYRAIKRHGREVRRLAESGWRASPPAPGPPTPPGPPPPPPSPPPVPPAG